MKNSQKINLTESELAHVTAYADRKIVELGAQIRALRLSMNIDQRDLASWAGVGLTPLKHLETGQGTTVRTLVRVVCALGRDEWLNQLSDLNEAPTRQRTSKPRSWRYAYTVSIDGGNTFISIPDFPECGQVRVWPGSTPAQTAQQSAQELVDARILEGRDIPVPASALGRDTVIAWGAPKLLKRG